jgi:hypothetical protein
MTPRYNGIVATGESVPEPIVQAFAAKPMLFEREKNGFFVVTSFSDHQLQNAGTCLTPS